MDPSNALDLRLITIAIYATSMKVLKQWKRKKEGVKLKLPINFARK
jgi:hypothetical protein